MNLPRHDTGLMLNNDSFTPRIICDATDASKDQKLSIASTGSYQFF